MPEHDCNMVDRVAARRRGIRSALRVAGLAGLIVASVGHAAERVPDKTSVEDAQRNVRIPHQGMSCRRWRFWGPPAPPPMRAGALTRLRQAARWFSTQFQRVWA